MAIQGMLDALSASDIWLQARSFDRIALSGFGQFTFLVSPLSALGVGALEPWPPGTRSVPQYAGQGPPGCAPAFRRGPFYTPTTTDHVRSHARKGACRGRHIHLPHRGRQA